MVKKRARFKEHDKSTQELRLDLGSGFGGKPVVGPDGVWPEGSYLRVDRVKHEKVDVVADLTERWPWKSGTVDRASADYILHLLSPAERVIFMNELHRVLKPGATVVIFTPHWCTSKAYLDPRQPPVGESWYFTLSKAWRDAQNYKDETGLTCDFENPVFGYGMHPSILPRNQEYQQHAIMYWKEAAQDLVVTLVKKE